MPRAVWIGWQEAMGPQPDPEMYSSDWQCQYVGRRSLPQGGRLTERLALHVDFPPAKSLRIVGRARRLGRVVGWWVAYRYVSEGAAA
jgi:hypothetical protein